MINDLAGGVVKYCLTIILAESKIVLIDHKGAFHLEVVIQFFFIVEARCLVSEATGDSVAIRKRVVNEEVLRIGVC